jgi:hypothetical protein
MSQRSAEKQIDSKYRVTVNAFALTDDDIDVDVHIVNLKGEPIPDDEPLFLLRGRDELAVSLLSEYLTLAKITDCTEYHIDGVKQIIERFMEFAAKHPERMKQPGITRGL